jgi:hypothetical protein
MGNNVYANNMEISCKAADGKTICDFPNVCFTPPQTPATPMGVPIPYPNTGMGSDTSDGSTSVKIGGEEVMLKNKSYFKKSVGDEAGCAPKKGVLNSKIGGKVFFSAWSMSVMAEGENLVRHLDITTGNHGSNANAPAPFPHLQRMGVGSIPATQNCRKAQENVNRKCKDEDERPCPSDQQVQTANDELAKTRNRLKSRGFEKYHQYSKQPSYGERRRDKKAAVNRFAALHRKNECAKALKCFLTSEEETEAGKGCCPGQTPHHLIPSSAIVIEGGRDIRNVLGREMVLNTVPAYDSKKAPCICAEGTSWHLGTHKQGHTEYANVLANCGGAGSLSYTDGIASATMGSETVTYEEALSAAMKSAEVLAPSFCQKCIEDQLNMHHLGTANPTKQQKQQLKVRKTMAAPKYQSKPYF